MKTLNKGTAKLVYGGIFSALSFIFLFLAGVIPKTEMGFYALASVMPALMIIECAGIDKKGRVLPGVLVYAVTVLMGLLLLPNKTALLPYVFLFGIYGVIKFYIDKFNSKGVRAGIKIVYFGGTFTIGYLFFKELLFSGFSLPALAFPLLLAGAVGFLMLYDYIFSLGLDYYFRRIHPRTFRNIDNSGED